VRKKTKAIFVMPFSHLDLFWLGNRHECWSRGARIFRQAIRLCRKDKRFRFLIEDAVFLDNFIRTVPECRAELKRLMRAGRIEAPAKWAAITTTNVNGETILRDHLYGMGYAESFCGRRPTAIHLGDIPGHPAQFPQIMAGCGLSDVILSRGGPSRNPLFKWQGLDGTRVTAWYSPKCYNWGKNLALPPTEFREKHEAALRKSADAIAKTTPSHVFMHAGWDLSLPTDHLIPNVAAWNRAEKDLPMRFSTQEEFFAAVRNARGIPVLSGELPTVWGNWPDAAYLDVTVHHAAAEAALLWAERLAALDMAEGVGVENGRHGGRPSGSDDSEWEESPEGPASVRAAAALGTAWRQLLESLDHNYSLIATEETHAEKNRLTESARMAAEGIVRSSMARRASAVALEGEAVPILVSNPSSFVRTEVVTARAIVYGNTFPNAEKQWEKYHLTDEHGAAVPVQEMGVRKCGARELYLVFPATDVPSLGYRTYYLRPGPAPDGSSASAAVHSGRHGGRPSGRNRRADLFSGGPTSVSADRNRTESGLRVRVDRRSGTLRVETGAKEVVIPALTFRGVEAQQTNQVMQLAATGKVFPFRCRKVTADAGPVVNRMLLEGTVAETGVRIAATLPAAGDRLELSVRLDHPGRGFYRLQLHAKLPGGREERGIVGGPFGANATTNVLPGCGPTLGDEVKPAEWARIREAQDWFLLKGRKSRDAVAVATPRKLVELLPEGFAVNLLSSMTAKWIKPDQVFHPFAGVYEMTFLIAPVKAGDAVAAARLGESGFMPLRVFCDYSGPGLRGRSPSQSGIRISNPAVRLTTLKPAEDGNGLVARFVESAGRKATTAIEWPFRVRGARECDMLERPGRRSDFRRIAFRPFEIRTFRFEVR
jgi:hypothetical protein